MIYTRKGDDGKTSLAEGGRVLKCDERVEAYGTVDELNAQLGVLRDMCPFAEEKGFLFSIQCLLFTIQSRLASVHPEQCAFLPGFPSGEVERLEREIDRMSESVPPFRSFVIAGGHPLLSQCHVARCVCRRAERRVVALMQREPVEVVLLHYINRLSDYLFVLARYFALRLDVKEDVWEKTE